MKFKFRFELAFGVLGELDFLGDIFVMFEAVGEYVVGTGCRLVMVLNGILLYFLLTLPLLFLIFFNRHRMRVFSTRSEGLEVLFVTVFSICDLSVDTIFIGPRIAALPFCPIDKENLPKLEERS